ncbi:60S ribosomal protein L6 [Globodera pallida]|nr:60S ribosomal protein L6 [Globodera pallida]
MPLRRIVQAFVIATKTKLDISSQYFVTDQRKQDQKSMDSQVLEVIRKHPEKKFLFGYLGSRFHLAKEMHPHKMVF